MPVILSILIVAVAVYFVFVGTRTAFRPIPELADKMPWVTKFSPRTVRIVGYAELAGGLGLVLPSMFGIPGVIALVAALALLVLMIAAAVFHLRLKDTKGAIPSIVLAIILAVLALNILF